MIRARRASILSCWLWLLASRLSAELPNPDLWSMQPVRRPTVSSASGNPIDYFVGEKLRRENLKPSPRADRIQLIRRLSFDLLGLPPAPEEVEAFVRDTHPDAWERLVDQMLASPRYGERWARHWLDVVRFAETHGFEMNQPRPNAWPYRDYVIRAFNQDKPYDRFVMEQLAGDQLGEDAATGFLVGGPWDQVKSPDEVLTKNQRADELHDIVSTTGSAFLGLTIGCARCHNHKFDPISQADYYAIKAIFAGVQHGDRPLPTSDRAKDKEEAEQLRGRLASLDQKLDTFEPMARSGNEASLRAPVNARRNVDRFEPRLARFVRFSIFATTDVEPCLDELEVYAGVTNLALAARPSSSGNYAGSDFHKLEHVNDGRYGNERSWISNQRGKGWVQLEWARAALVDRVVWGRDGSPSPQYRDRLATDYQIALSPDGVQWTVVASSADRWPFSKAGEWKSGEKGNEATLLLKEKEELQKRIKQLLDLPSAYAGQFKMPEPTQRLQRGDPMQPRETIAPGYITKLQGCSPAPALSTNSPEAERRLDLARWIASTNNPLTARVIVNRLWQHHFGEGIVATPSDFGANGARPVFPELLDWLAAELMSPECGWRLKPIHRLILTSETYRQSSASGPKGLRADAASRWLWRFPPQRLEAEAIRDSMLQVAGKLDLRMGGPGWSPFEPNDNYVRVYQPKEKFSATDFRRMIYATAVRQRPDGVFGPFDCPDGGQVAPRRSSSTTPLQALNLLNSGFVMQVSEAFAGRLQRDCGQDPVRQIERAFQLAFGRACSSEEQAASKTFVAGHGLILFCRALLNANEFIYVF